MLGALAQAVKGRGHRRLERDTTIGLVPQAKIGLGTVQVFGF